MAIFEIYIDSAGEYRWRFKANNGEPVAQSEGYKSKAGAKNGIEALKREAAAATVDDQTLSSIARALSKVMPPPPPPPPPRSPLPDPRLKRPEK